jgi:hypothetical protein
MFAGRVAGNMARQTARWGRDSIPARSSRPGGMIVPDPQKQLNVAFLNPPGLYDPAPNGYSHVAIPAPGTRVVAIAGNRLFDAQGRGAGRRALAPGWQ